MGFQITGAIVRPSAKESRVRPDVVAEALAALRDAPALTPWFSGMVVATKGIAQSDADVYRQRLIDDHQVPVRGQARLASEVVALALSFIPEVPALEVPQGTSTKDRAAMKKAHAAKVQARLDVIPADLRNAAPDAWSWLLVKVQQVTRLGVVIGAASEDA